MLKSELKYSTVGSMLWKLFERGGRAAVELLVQIVMARLLAPEQFGALAVMLVFVNIGNVFVQSGLNTALVQAPEVTSKDYSTVFWMSFAIAVALYLVLCFTAPAIASFYSMPNLVSPLRVLGLLLIINAYNSVQIAKITRDLQMKKIFIATMISVSVSAASGILVALSGFGLWALVVQQITYQLSNCIALSFQVDWHPSLVFDRRSAKNLFHFGGRLLVSGLLEQCYQSMADLVVGKQFSSANLGLMSQGKKYPQAIGSVLDGAIQPVMLSAVSRIQKDRSGVKLLVRRALKTSTFVIVPAMTLFACSAPTLVPIILGEQWAPSIPFLQIYCLVFALLPLHTTNLQSLNGIGRSDVFLRLQVVKTAYGVALVLISAFVFKSVYVLAFSYLLDGIISTYINARPNKELIGYSYKEQMRDVAPVYILSAISALVSIQVLHVQTNNLLILVLQIVVFLVIYYFGSKGFNKEELNYLVRMVRDYLK